MNGVAVGCGHIDGNEIDAAFHETGNKMDIAGEAIKLGDDQLGFLLAAKGEGGGKVRPVVFLATLDFGEFLEQSTTAA